VLAIFHPPLFDDDEKTECAQSVFLAAWVTLALDLFIMAAITLAQPPLASRTGASDATEADVD